jgi:anti-sigma factor RsiW
MTKPSTLTEKEKADLVAYLDGELPDEAARAMEAKISLNSEARAEAESLRRAWDLLEYLPRPEPSPTFTSRTLSKVTPVGNDRWIGSPWAYVQQRWEALEARWRLAVLGAGWAVVLLLAFFGGRRAFNWAAPRKPGEKEMVRDLRLIKNKPFYDLVGDVETLNKLDHPDLFGE